MQIKQSKQINQHPQQLILLKKEHKLLKSITVEPGEMDRLKTINLQSTKNHLPQRYSLIQTAYS